MCARPPLAHLALADGQFLQRLEPDHAIHENPRQTRLTGWRLHCPGGDRVAWVPEGHTHARTHTHTHTRKLPYVATDKLPTHLHLQTLQHTQTHTCNTHART